MGRRETFDYKEKPFNDRLRESGRIRTKYEDRIPVICEKHTQSDVPNIDKTKYLVPQDLNAGQFIYVVRKRIKLQPEKALFLFVDGMLPPTGMFLKIFFSPPSLPTIIISYNRNYNNIKKKKKKKLL